MEQRSCKYIGSSSFFLATSHYFKNQYPIDGYNCFQFITITIKATINIFAHLCDSCIKLIAQSRLASQNVCILLSDISNFSHTSHYCNLYFCPQSLECLENNILILNLTQLRTGVITLQNPLN